MIAGIAISHRDRVMYPDRGLTKLDVAKYYEAIGDWMLPHVAGRPLTLVHCPNGMSGACTFMKHSKSWGPRVLRRVQINEKKKIGEYLVADSISAIVGIAQMSVLEIHTWNSTTDDIERPNRIVFDLDPGDNVSWPHVIAAARLVRKALAALDLECFVKTTGGRGLHVVAPLIPDADWSECLEFSRGISELVASNDPHAYTTTFAKMGRESKILLDYLRNNRTNTSIAAYSLRARPGAPVSVPVTWNELKSSLDPGAFSIETILRRMKRRRVDPWKNYETTQQRLTSTMLKAVRVESTVHRQNQQRQHLR
ncbi:MAG TPA: non-homologous end-joining DNA ligase [Gemmatimonadaceae bacterium]|nr:non-homologous end-joining DNA ligase [Gemmatimonadaceae bacterium]